MSKKVLVVAVLAVALASPAAAMATTKLLVYRTGTPAYMQVKPSDIVLSGDDTGRIGRLPYLRGMGRNCLSAYCPGGRQSLGTMHWRYWQNSQAYADEVTVWSNDCLPDCAQGTWWAGAGTFYAWRPVSGHFTRFRLKWTLTRADVGSSAYEFDGFFGYHVALGYSYYQGGDWYGWNIAGVF